MRYPLAFLVAIYFATLPTVAAAGPAVAIATAVVSAIKTSVVLTALVQVAASVVISKISQKIAAKKMRKAAAANAASQQRRTSVFLDLEMGDTLPLSFQLGKTATAGKYKYIGSWGRNTRFITRVIEISSLPQNSLLGLWVDSEKASIDYSKRGAFGWSQPTGEVEGIQNRLAADMGGWMDIGYPVSAGITQGKSLIWVKWINGTQTATDPFLAAAFGSDPQYPWSGAGLGKTYAIVTVQYDADVMTNFPSFIFEPSPLRLYDPRKDSTVGGSGGHRWGDMATYSETENAAVISYNIIRGIYWGSEWVYGGKNLDAWRLPLAEWVAAMNASDRNAPIGGGGTEPSYRVGYEARGDEPPADLLSDIERSCNLRFVEVGGRMKVCADLPVSSVYTITDDDIIITEGQSFTPFTPMLSTYNAIAGSYPEPQEMWTDRDAPEFISSVFIGQDGGRYLPTSIQLPTCPYRWQVQRVMASLLKDYRRMRVHVFSLPPSAYILEPMDMLTWTSSRNGYTNKQFIVESIFKTVGMNVSVTVKEVDPEDYDGYPDELIEPTITEPVNPIRFSQGIFGFTAEGVAIQDNELNGRVPAIQVSCGSAEVGVDFIRIQLLRSGSVVMDITRPYSEPYVWTIMDVAPNTTYSVRGALISTITGLYVWSAPVSVTTPDIKVGLTNLEEAVLTEFERIAADMGVLSVDALPSSGERPDQLVFLTTTKTLYRWDEATLSWTTELYTAIADDSIMSNHIAANQVLANHVAANTLTADKLNVLSMSSAGLAVFGGAIQSNNYSSGLSGWRIENGGNAEFNSLVVRRNMIVSGAVSSTYEMAGETLVFDNSNTQYLNFNLWGGGGLFAPAEVSDWKPKNPVVMTFHGSIGKRSHVGHFQLYVEMQVALAGSPGSYFNAYAGGPEFNALYMGTINPEGGMAMSCSGLMTNSRTDFDWSQVARIRLALRANGGNGVLYRPKALVQQISR